MALGIVERQPRESVQPKMTRSEPISVMTGVV